MKEVLNVFVKKCEAAGRYGEWNCIVNAKLIFSLLFLLNAASIITLALGRKRAVELLPANRNTVLLYFAGIMAVEFIALSLLYPKRKILSVQLNQAQIASRFRLIIFYLIFTVGLYVVSITLRE